MFAPDQDSEQCASDGQEQEEGRGSLEEGRGSLEEGRGSQKEGCGSQEEGRGTQGEGRVRSPLEKPTLDSEDGECTSLDGESEGDYSNYM